MYEKYYGLTAMPFAITPDPRFFYASKGHKKAFSYLCYGMVKSEGFVVITGEPGLGKSTIAYRLLDQKIGPELIVGHITTTQINADNLLRMISSGFCLEYERKSKAALLRNIEAFLHERNNAGQRCVLVIDEAQNLPLESLEELRMLSNIQKGPKALLQTFLLGQNLLTEKLTKSCLIQFRQRIIASLHLKPLQLNETIEYIHSRLKKVNWKNDPDFSDEAYQAVFRFTEGNPRKINICCDRLLLSACMDETHFIDVEHVEQIMDELSNEISGQFKFDKQVLKIKAAKEQRATVSGNNEHKSKHKDDNELGAISTQILTGVSVKSSIEDLEDNIVQHPDVEAVLKVPDTHRDNINNLIKAMLALDINVKDLNKALPNE